MSKEHLATYLNDHLAGADFALQLLDHLAAENSDVVAAVATLKREAEEDRRQLKELMASIGVTEGRARKAGNWIAEGLAELKLDVDDEPNGPLRRLERLEALAIGIDGKVALWSAMNEAARVNSELRVLDYMRLGQRGLDQRARVESLRLQAASTALTAR